MSSCFFWETPFLCLDLIQIWIWMTRITHLMMDDLMLSDFPTYHTSDATLGHISFRLRFIYLLWFTWLSSLTRCMSSWWFTVILSWFTSGLAILWTLDFAWCVSIRWWTRFLFVKKKIFFRKDLELPLIFVLFLKGKQNKKKNPKCDSLFGKDNLWKTKVGSRSQVTYWECTVKNRSTPLSSIMRSLLIKVKQVWQLVRKPMDTKE